MKSPMISVILSVGNAQEYLRDTLDSIKSQTFGDFEVICVNSGSPEALNQSGAEDSRFRTITRENVLTGTAWNLGMDEAKGDYVMFLDCGDLAAPQLLEKLYACIVDNNGDIAVCNYGMLEKNGRVKACNAVYTGWIPGKQQVFSWRDCPDYIMRILNSETGNKLYKTAFLRATGLKFAELSTDADAAFSAVTACAADRIAFIGDSLMTCRSRNLKTPEAMKNVVSTVEFALEQANALAHADQICNGIQSFAVKNLIFALVQRIGDFSDPAAGELYEKVHQILSGEAYANATPRTLRNPKQYRELCAVRKHNYETMKAMVGRRMIVSLTTYPKRIGTLHTVLESIYAQTRKADEVVLWLAQEQFPGKEADLPETLLQLIREKKLTVRWCEDLKPHKKYFYALQEYTEDLVVTVDDDLLYPADMLDCLYRSYLQYPKAISTVRAHLIMVSEDHEIMPYSTWIQETDQCIYEPSMQLLATGGAGCLYPPGLLRKELFDAQAIRENCLWADDLWLKVMQLMSDVPVVVARPFEPLHYLPNSQEEALHRLNVGQNHNDVQLASTSKWLDEKYEKGILIKKLTQQDAGVRILGMEAVSRHINEERKAVRRSWIQADGKIQQCEEKVRQTQSKLQQTERQLAQTEKKLQQLQKQLQQAQAESMHNQVIRMGEVLQNQKQQKGISPAWCVKKGCFLLAKIAKKGFSAMYSLIVNGFSGTVKK